MEPDLQRRIAANEQSFRQVNEGIERGQWPGEEDDPVGFRCECAQLGCNQMVELTVRDYERVRRHSRRFVGVPGHEVPEAETVVESHRDYVVVEKRGQAGREAEASDPRS